MGLRRALVVAVAAATTWVAGGSAQAAFDPAYEQRNYSKMEERNRFVTGTPAYQVLLREKGLLREAQAAQIQAGDPGRFFEGQLCWQKMDGCAGEVRAYDFASRGAGLATPVTWVARNGSVISGHVFATAEGPARRPGAVLTTGSVQAPEELYWTAAQALAKAGYVVLTWDVQNQGYSDSFGEGADRNDGFPSQSGQPFYDGTEDALDFFFSSAAQPYAPRRSCSSGTDHSAKQNARVQAGRGSAFNPFDGLLDRGRVGVFGHSLGAGAVSYIGQLDPRVKAIVAYDNLGAQAPDAAAPPVRCASGSSPRPATLPLTKPALGISNDYGLFREPMRSEPDPNLKTVASRRLSAAGTDTMQVNIRGGTHYESSIIANPAFGGTLRGNDLTVYYTVAWFDRYVKGDRAATARVLTQRWRQDAPGAAVDPDQDPNTLSRYFRSRADLTGPDGARVVCEDLREGCAALAPEGDPEPYDAIAVVQAKGAAGGPGLDELRATCSTNTTDPAGATGAPSAATKQTPPCAGRGGARATPTAGSVAGCRDARAPVSRFRLTRLTRRALTVRGRSADAGCGGRAGRVAGVSLAVAREAGRRCRFLRADGRFGAPVSCLRTPYLPAKGAASWTFERTARFAPGRYKLFVRGVDAAGNVERKARTRTFRRLRLR
jgi:dienelactone hydrolase